MLAHHALSTLSAMPQRSHASGRAGILPLRERPGDTFRWGGENVSAADFTGVVASCPGVGDAAAHGIQRPMPVSELLGADYPAQLLRTNLPIVTGVVIPFLAQAYRARL